MHVLLLAIVFVVEVALNWIDENDDEDEEQKQIKQPNVFDMFNRKVAEKQVRLNRAKNFLAPGKRIVTVTAQFSSYVESSK